MSLERGSDLAVSVSQGAQLSTQTGPLLLHRHHWKKTERESSFPNIKAAFDAQQSLRRRDAVTLLGLIYSR